MLRKTLLFIIIVLAAAAPRTVARELSGSWTLYPTVADYFSDVVETPTKVYLLSGGTLMHQSTEDNEFYVYGSDRLSENTGIRFIRYNAEGKYLLVIYTNGNIDLLYDDGSVYNLPEVKNAVLTTTHGITDAAFHEGRIYLSTDFGLVVYDDKKREVVESGIYNTQMHNVFVMSGHIVLVSNPDNNHMVFLTSPLESRHHDFSRFTKNGECWTHNDFRTNIYKLSENILAYYHTNGNLTARALNFEAGNDEPYRGLPSVQLAQFRATDNGAMFITDSGALYFADGTEVSSPVALPATGYTSVFSSKGNSSSVWVSDNDGILTQYNLAGSQPVQLLNIVQPEGFSCIEPTNFRWSSDGSRLLVSNRSANYDYQVPGDNWDTPLYVDEIKDGRITDVAVHNGSKGSSLGITYYTYDRATGRLNSSLVAHPDPDDPDIHYVANNRWGVGVVKDNSLIAAFTAKNSPMIARNLQNEGRNPRLMDVTTDNDGNLWISNGYAEGNQNTYAVLPADKRRGDLSKIQKSDWVTVPAFFSGDEAVARLPQILFSKKYPRYAIFNLGNPNEGFYVCDNNGTPLNFADDRRINFKQWTDTEGNSLSPYRIISLAEDADGKIWVGTDQGLFVIENITKAFDADFRVRRPIVPRNDGTIYGDYLLGSELIYGIAVDPSNRKWIATRTAGVYLVSSDGTRIIANYTTENSPLPSNIVESVTCDPNSNIVYFGTPYGMASFLSDSSPAAPDYSDVYAYPNPVRPEYTGWITVKGLMDNSLVKIADIAGNVFFQGRSEGGMISWDGCDADGRRVRSGIYLVLASQGDDSGSSGVVTKIMVVN